MSGALEGLRVLELGSSEAAAYCGKLFADFGAEVIKVEPPGGDRLRQVPPLVEPAPGRSESALFAWLNTNKQSLVLDLATATGQASLDELAAGADVLIDARPAPDHLAWRARNPALSIVALSWFGENGPYAGFQGTDSVARALAGLVWPIGSAGEPPEPPNDHQAGVITGLSAFIAALSDQMAKAPGRRFEVAELEANLALAEYAAVTGIGPYADERRFGRNRFRPTFPMGVYPCREGWLGLTVVTLEQWRSFCEVFDLPQLAAEPELDMALGRFARADELETLFRPKLLQETAETWFERLRARRVPAVLTPDMAELRRQSVHRERGAFAEVSIGEARFEAPALPQHVARPRLPGGGRAPLPGERAPHVEPWTPRDPRGSAGGERPLDGLRIIDLTMGWAGPLATRTLADLGAEVIKVESCVYPDWWRTLIRTPEALAQRQYEQSPIFNLVNRGKKGITLDLTTPTGVDLLKRLVAGADAVIENYSAEVLPKLGLDYSRLVEVRPDLVMVSMPAFGGKSAWRDVRAYGSTLEQGSGLPTIVGAPDAPPTMIHLALGDPVGGLNAAAALLVALRHRRRTGEGQHVDLSQIQCLFPLVAPWFIEQSVTGKVERLGPRHPTMVPHGAFPCLGEEEWLQIAVVDDLAWRALCQVIGREDLATDRRLATLDGRRAEEGEVEAAVAAWTRTQDAQAAMLALQNAGVAAGVARRPSRLFDDPHLTAREAIVWIDRPYIGRHPQFLAPFRPEGRAYPVTWPSTLLGEFNAEILSRLGLSEGDLAALEDEGVIGSAISQTPRRRAS